MEDLGLQEDGGSNPETKYDSDVASSPESKRRRLMSDSSSSHTDEPSETFGSPDPPIPMPIPDEKKEDDVHADIVMPKDADVHAGIVMPTAPKEEERLGGEDKVGTSSGGLEGDGGAEIDADKGAGAGEDAPREEKSKEELAEEERKKMQ